MQRLVYLRNKGGPLVLVTGTYLSYVIIFAAYHDYAQTGISSLLIVPVIAASWYFGAYGGIATAILCVLATALIPSLAGPSQAVFTLSNYLRMFTTLLVAVFTGRFGTMTRERREALERLEELGVITKIILESRDLESTLKSLVSQIAHLFRADDAFFSFWDEEKSIPTPLIAHGSMSRIYPTLSYAPGEGKLTSAVMESGHPVAVPDLRSSPYWSSRFTSLFPSHSMLAIPLIIQGRKLATFYLGYNVKRRFSQKEIDDAERAAQQIALVLMKTQLLDGAQKQVKQLTALHEISVIATQVDSVDRLVEHTTKIIGKNLFPDNFGVLLMDEENCVLRPHPSYRFTVDNEIYPRDVPLGQGITGQVGRTGEPIRVGNVKAIPNYLDVDSGTASELCVPIRLKTKVLGVINAESTKADAFSLDDELLLGTLAGQLATAMEELRAAAAERKWLHQLAHSNELISTLAHITTHLEKALSQEAIIQTLGEELKKIGITCALAVHHLDRRSFTITYTSMPKEALEKLENGIGSPFIGFHFSIDRLNSGLRAEDFLKHAVIANPEEQIRLFFFTQRENGNHESCRSIQADPETVHFRLLLVFEEKLLGILWFWSKTLTESDLPVLSTFAKQIAGALERARLFQEVQDLALTDSLTGLPNRRSLFELGKIEFARSYRTKRPFCCMLLDVDHFKQINDTYGHQAGDQVLREFSQCSKRSIREVDLIGRYGGEELLILLPETDPDTALQVAERLRAAVENLRIKISDQVLHVTVSIGISMRDNNTLELETLIARADQAMYIAKHRGRNRVAFSK
jgi:diguanylate cyclase (GGDEF)-like protein